MILAPVAALLVLVVSTAQAQANIPIKPLTNVSEANKTPYFSDPYYVPYEGSQEIYIAGTTPSYLECNQTLSSECAHKQHNNYNTSDTLEQAAHSVGTNICSAAGIHPFQSGSGPNRTWDAVVTLHVSDKPCHAISGWSVIVHAHPSNDSIVDTPPRSWVGDEILVGSFKKEEEEDANYDGKYFKTPAGELYLVYQKQKSSDPKRDGVVARPMDDFKTPTPGANDTFLLLPDDDLNSENYHPGNTSFKLIETGNMQVINGKFVMAYSAGAYNNQSYKLGVAYSDTFLPAPGQQYRKVMKNNPDNLWGTTGKKEVYYLLQAEVKHDGWRYVGNQVLAPGVPTVAQIGPDGGWILLFAGYDANDHPIVDGSNKYQANHRRPYFVGLNVSVPADTSVEQATDSELQKWIRPVHGQA